MRLFLWVILVLSWFNLSFYFFENRSSPRLRAEYVTPPEKIKNNLLGQKFVFSDVLWIRAIQDFDSCQSAKVISDQICQPAGWLYKMLDFVTELDPYFKKVYSAGALSLSIIASDIKGASQLFDKGLIYIKDDWTLYYKAAYHAIYEEKNFYKGAKLMQQAAQKGAPFWVYSLSANLYSQSENKQDIVLILEGLKNLNISDELKNQLNKKIKGYLLDADK